MNLKRLVPSLAAFTLGLSSCATVETPPAGAVPGPALWQVADEDTTIYLFGTVHALPQSTNWFDGRIERAFDASDELVTEIDVGDAGKSQRARSGATTGLRRRWGSTSERAIGTGPGSRRWSAGSPGPRTRG